MDLKKINGKINLFDEIRVYIFLRPKCVLSWTRPGTPPGRVLSRGFKEHPIRYLFYIKK